MLSALRRVGDDGYCAPAMIGRIRYGRSSRRSTGVHRVASDATARAIRSNAAPRSMRPLEKRLPMLDDDRVERLHGAACVDALAHGDELFPL